MSGRCVYPLGELTEPEKEELRALHAAWIDARSRKDYAVSDRLREDLARRGCLPPDYALWHPLFESNTHLAARGAARNETNNVRLAQNSSDTTAGRVPEKSVAA